MATSNPSSIKIRTGFQPIFGHTFHPANEKKGSDLVSHVFNVEETRANGKTEITASVIREMKIRDDHFRVTFDIDSNRTIKSARCSCVAGCDGFCKHSFAVFFYVNHERTEACTDKQQEWLKPSQKLRNLYPKGKTIQKLFCEEDHPERDFSGSSMTIGVSDFCAKMKELGLEDTSMFKMFTAKPQQFERVRSQSSVLPEILSIFRQPLLFNAGTGGDQWQKIFPRDDKTKAFFEEKIAANADECTKIFQETIGQADNPKWFLARKHRITASSAHKIVRARSKQQRLKYFGDTVLSTKSMQHGQTTEPIAKDQFSILFKKEVHPSGLVVSEELPWLACTPDGLIKEENGSISVLEIKCPSSCKDGPVSVDYIEDGKLKENHSYYMQVQLQLYLSKAKMCYFFVFTFVDFLLIKVEIDPAFL